MNGTSCADSANWHRYIQNFTCSNPNATKGMLKQMRLSFPSGHASFAFVTMIFCVVIKLNILTRFYFLTSFYLIA